MKKPKTSRYIPISNERCEELVVRALVNLGYTVKYLDGDAVPHLVESINIYSLQNGIPQWSGQFQSFDKILNHVLNGWLPDRSINANRTLSKVQPNFKTYPNKDALEIELDALGVTLDDYSWKKLKQNHASYMLGRWGNEGGEQ